MSLVATISRNLWLLKSCLLWQQNGDLSEARMQEGLKSSHSNCDRISVHHVSPKYAWGDA